uniref:Uncharacterized protein n=1 Tax=Amphimedon queenslandica TaxID=400682 RepID=A0A1X7UI68_AMPQE
MSSLGLLGEYGSGSSGSDDEAAGTANTEESLSNRACSSKVGIEHSYFNADDIDSASDTGSSEYSLSPGPVDSPLAPDAANSKPLPLPQLDDIHCGIIKAEPGSVFSNPFKEAEETKLLALKQHVALGPAEVPVDKTKNERSFRGKRRRRQGDQEETGSFDKYDSSIKRGKMNRPKSGVAPGLVPPQKYMKLHQRQQEKERPWTVKRSSN